MKRGRNGGSKTRGRKRRGSPMKMRTGKRREEEQSEERRRRRNRRRVRRVGGIHCTIVLHSMCEI